MQTINIEVVDVKVEQKGKSNRMIVTHKELDSGKLDGKQLVEFYTDKTVWSTLASAKSGDFFAIDREKNDAGYWEWRAVHRQDSPPVPSTTGAVKQATTQARSTYETPEERAARQILIVRQSSVASAVAYLKGETDKPDPDYVVAVAKRFEAYVLGTDKEFDDVPL
jgi:hypothetical protein